MILMMLWAITSQPTKIDWEYRALTHARTRCVSAMVRDSKMRGLSLKQFSARFDKACPTEVKRHRDLTRKRLMEERNMTGREAARYLAEQEVKVRKIFIDGYRRNPRPTPNMIGYVPPVVIAPPPPSPPPPARHH